MKKVFFVICVLGTLLLSITGCKQNEVKNELIEESTPLSLATESLGKDLDEALSKYGLKEAEVTETDRYHYYLLSKEVDFNGREYEVHLFNDEQQGTISNGYYLSVFAEDDSISFVVQTFQKTVDQIKKECGEPSTSKDFPTTNEMREDPESFLAEKGSIYEAWNLGKDYVHGKLKEPIAFRDTMIENYDELYVSITLEAIKQPDGKFVLKISFFLSKTPNM